MNALRESLYPPQFAQPELVIPHAPGRRWILRAVAGQRSWLAAFCAFAGVLIAELVDVSVRPYVFVLVAAAMVYAVVSAVTVTALRRRQASFEPAWLEAQSEVLRGKRFEVVRLSTSEPEDTERGRRARRRFYDLTQPGEVARLLALRSRAVAEGLNVPVTVEFGYQAGDATGLERVRSELTAIPIVARPDVDVTPGVWFPDGRYVAQPATQRPVTYWVLGPPTLMVARPDSGQARAKR